MKRQHIILPIKINMMLEQHEKGKELKTNIPVKKKNDIISMTCILQ